MITELTPCQESQLTTYHKKWMKIGLYIEPADRTKAENAIELMYINAELKPPKEVIWLDSPLLFYINDIAIKAKREDKAWNPVRNGVRDKALAQIKLKIAKNIIDYAWDKLIKSGIHKLEEQVSDHIWCEAVKISPNRHLCLVFLSGQHEAAWLGFYEYFRDIFGLVQETNCLQGLIDFGKSAGWAFLTKDACLVSERPNVIKLKEGKLHCEDGPAISYPDGFSIWALNGERVTREIIENSTCNSTQKNEK